MELRRQGFVLPDYDAVPVAAAISQEAEREFRAAPSAQEPSATGNPVPGGVVRNESLLRPDADEFRSGPIAQSDLSIGIVVPVLNESNTLAHFLSRLYEVGRGRYPVVVVDGGSMDDSVRIARQFFHTETISTPNRGMQLNHGAGCLFTDLLLFLHADSELPRGFDFHIRRALADPGIVGGCFRLEFDCPAAFLKFYAWFTQFRGRFFHYGDQAFFVRRETFCEMGGFSPLPFLEDVEFLRRLKRIGRFAVLPTSVRTSARRFMRHGIVRQQLANILLVTLFELGVSAGRLAKFYQHAREGESHADN
jgi:rSAM/selenodomain-associated transferase 2